MKKYVTVDMEIIEFDVEDIITESPINGDDGDGGETNWDD